MNRSSATAPAEPRPTRRSPLLAALAATTLATFSAFAQRPELIPNHVKYADTGIPHATGRSGSAVIQARALLDRDGRTAVEITTGAFEDRYNVPGNIDKIQLQIADGDPANSTIIANHLQDGGWNFVQVPGLRRHQPVEIKANISGIDGNRTDIVTANEIVKLRPDLVVDRIDMPAKAPVNMPVNIDAIVSEVNHDVGVRGNCYLLVDGVNVDTAENIWVDAGDSVTCSFSTVFPSIGTKQIEVVVDSRGLNEWDNQNNSATASIVIEPVIGFTATASQNTDDYEYTSTFETSWSHGTDHVHNTVMKTVNKFDAYLPYEMNPDGIRVGYSESYDGQPPAFDYAPGRLRFFGPGNWPRANCSVADARYLVGIVCSGDGITQITITRGATKAVYLSEHWEQYLGGDNQWHEQHYTIRMPQTAGQTFPFNQTLTYHITADDGTRYYDISPVVQLEAYEDPAITTSGCRDTPWGSHECYESRRVVSGKRGKTTGE
jgi:hypothetical protein